jgi:hypothetical protein
LSVRRKGWERGGGKGEMYHRPLIRGRRWRGWLGWRGGGGCSSSSFFSLLFCALLFLTSFFLFLWVSWYVRSCRVVMCMSARDRSIRLFVVSECNRQPGQIHIKSVKKRIKTSEMVQQERNEEETKSKSHKKKDIPGIYKSPMRSILTLLALMVTRLARETLHASLSSIFHNALFGKATSQL